MNGRRLHDTPLGRAPSRVTPRPTRSHGPHAGGILQYKILSLLLQHPDQRLLAARAEIRAAMASLPRSPRREESERFLQAWQEMGTLALEQH
jgi:hypothetical protein